MIIKWFKNFEYRYLADTENQLRADAVIMRETAKQADIRADRIHRKRMELFKNEINNSN